MMARTLLIALVVLLGVFASPSSAATVAHEELLQNLAAVGEAVLAAHEHLARFDAETDAGLFLELDTALQADSETEAEAEADAESAAEVDMEEAFGLERGLEDPDDQLFLESDAETENHSGAHQRISMVHEAAVTASAEADAVAARDPSAGMVVVHAAQGDHAQDADPIVSEQMEMQAALDRFGLLEAGAEAEVDADAALEAEAEAEADADADAEMEATVGEDDVAYTKCGKKIIFEKKEETAPAAPLPEA